MTEWRAGDIGAEHNGSLLAKLIQTGQRLSGDRQWQWNHIFVVATDQGGTIEADSRGVGRSNVGSRACVKLRFPDGVDRAKVVAAAEAAVGTKYNYVGVVLLGIDCLLGTKFHSHGSTLFCSELGARALKAGGWRCKWLASEIKPADLVDLLGTDPS